MDQDPLIGRVIAQYRVLECLGEGGMGVVYLAEDTRLKRKVALKFIRTEAAAGPAEAARFMREAQAAAALSHPHITTVHDVGLAQGRLFIAMEFLEGKTIREEVASGPLPLEKALGYALQAADGLQAAHEKGIVHRDIKSANLMVSPNGTVKITDFGLARLDESTETTQTGSVVGTVAYMSPEQASGEVVDHRTDIWALGVVLFEMVTGRRPFLAANDRATLKAILTAKPPSPGRLRKGLPPELERIIDKCLEKDPSRRYQSAAALKSDLGRLSQSVSGRTRTVSASSASFEGPSGILRRRFLRPVLFGLGAICLAGLAVGLFRPLRHTLARLVGLEKPAPSIHLAVLPFDVVGGSDEDAAFGQGLAEILTDRLSQVERYQGALRVVPAVVMRGYKQPSAVKLWRDDAFNCNRALSVTLMFLDQDVKLTLNLIDSPTLRTMSSQALNLPRTALGTLPESVSNAAAEELGLLLKPETVHAWSSRDVCRGEAGPLYVQAKGHLSRNTADEVGKAIALFQQATALDPQCAVAFAGLSEAFSSQYELAPDKTLLNQAQAAAEQALKLNKNMNRDLAEVHVTLGVLLRVKGELEQSIKQLTLATDLDPKSAGAFLQLGYSYERLGRNAAAEKAYRRAIDLEPGAWKGYQFLGTYSMFHGQLDEAEKDFLKIRELTPYNIDGYNLLGALYLQTGRYDKAEAMLNESINLSPTPNAYSNLGTAYFYERKYADAAAMYRKALDMRIGEDVQSLWGNLGDALRFVPGSESQARDAYAQAVQVVKGKIDREPTNAIWHRSAARFYALMGAKDEALAEMEQATKLMPGNTTTLEMAVQVYELCGKRDKALDSLRELVRLGGSVELVEANPDLAGLRQDPRYRPIVERKRNSRP